MVFRFDYWCFGDIVLSTVTFLFLYMWGVFFLGCPGLGLGLGSGVEKDLPCVADISFSCRCILFFGRLLLCTGAWKYRFYVWMSAFGDR